MTTDVNPEAVDYPLPGEKVPPVEHGAEDLAVIPVRIVEGEEVPQIRESYYTRYVIGQNDRVKVAGFDRQRVRLYIRNANAAAADTVAVMTDETDNPQTGFLLPGGLDLEDFSNGEVVVAGLVAGPVTVSVLVENILTEEE